ncbi:MAG: biotin--[acetyl-CoA-carboxylase] ligase [Actinomycetota bacterium]|nr:biotin--[acetyl-CoA-carboxylase] ligase [Actinomycetota bacterium]
MDYLRQLELNDGWKIFHSEISTSTNSELLAYGREGGLEGSILITDHQSSGKGRLGRIWNDEPGSSLLMSILLRPKVAFDAYFFISMTLGISIVEALQDYGVDAKLKWPNDLLVGEKKLAGILAEIETGKENLLVIGVGVNLNQSTAQLAELQRPATSVVIATGRSMGLEERLDFAKRAIERFREKYDRLQSSNSRDELVKAYRRYSATIGRFVRVDFVDGESVAGNCLDITERGELMVEVDTCIRMVDSADVHHLFTIEGC